MPSTYTPLATSVLTSNTATVSFSSISQLYTDLVLIITSNHTTDDIDGSLRINDDTATNYSRNYINGNGTAIGVGRNNNINATYPFVVWKSYSTSIIHFNNYTNTSINKTIISRYSNGEVITGGVATLWRSTAAINKITLSAVGGSFVSGSTFSLYGIKAA